MNGFYTTLERKETVANASPKRFAPVRKIAEHLSRRNLAGAKAEILNEALEKLTLLCYESDGTGFCNIDRVTGRILIPVPCGRLGYQYWGLYPTEAKVLRVLMLDLIHADRPTLYYYDYASRSWYVNISDWPTYESAQFWLGRSRITAAMWHDAYNAYRDGVSLSDVRSEK